MQLDVIQLLLWFITILLGIIVWGGKLGIKSICDSIERKVDRPDCEKTHQAIKEEHAEMWGRINHHQHSEEGRVVID